MLNDEVERMFNIQCSIFKLKGKTDVLKKGKSEKSKP